MASAATTITVVDQDGKPVTDAVVSFAGKVQQTTKPTESAIMDQVNKQFVPRVLVINKGQQVTFPNSDEVRHHVYSFSAIKPFEIKLYKGSDEAPVVYEKPGIGVLGCNIHDSMIGYIYVTEDEIAKVTSDDGEVTFEQPLPPKVTVWHAQLSLNQTERVVMPVDTEKNRIEIPITLIKKTEKRSTFGSRKFGQKG